jgi:hypothetical protein
VVQINASLHFEPAKINIFHKDCKRSGRSATCLAAFLCFTPIFLAPYFQMATVGKAGPCVPSSVSPWAFPWLCFTAWAFCEIGSKCLVTLTASCDAVILKDARTRVSVSKADHHRKGQEKKELVQVQFEHRAESRAVARVGSQKSAWL